MQEEKIAFYKTVYMSSYGKPYWPSHFGYTEGPGMMHGTSNMPNNILDQIRVNTDSTDTIQWKTHAIPSLVKSGSKNPGTIITKNYEKKGEIIKNINSYILVSKFERDDVLRKNHKGFDVEERKYKYTKDAVDRIFEIIASNSPNIDKEIANDLATKIANGAYAEEFDNLSELDWKDHIDKNWP